MKGTQFKFHRCPECNKLQLRVTEPLKKAPCCPKCGSGRAYYSDVWYIAFKDHLGKKHVQAVSQFKEFSAKKLHEVVYEVDQRIYDPELATLKWKDACDLFEKFITADKKVETQKYYRQKINNLRKYATKFPERVEDLTDAHVKEYMVNRLQNVTNSTVRHEVKTILYMIKCFVTGEILDDNNLRYIKTSPLLKVKLPVVNDQPEQEWAPEEVKLLLANTDHPWVRAYILFGCHAALRYNTIKRMKLSYINMEKNRLELPASSRKRGKYIHYVELSSSLRESIENILKDHPGGDYLFPGKGTRSAFWTSFNQLWFELKNKIGIDKRFHDLKHTAGTSYYKVTKDIYATAEFLDHKDINQTKRYARRYDEHRKEEMGKFEKMFE